MMSRRQDRNSYRDPRGRRQPSWRDMLVHGGVVTPRTGQEALIRVLRDLRGRSRAQVEGRKGIVRGPLRGSLRQRCTAFMVHYGVSGFTLGSWVGEALVSGAEAGLLIGFDTARAHASRAQRAEAMTRGTW
ncbi:hypothetical protein GGI35DRAFT_127095 [Trichoderma velutinum]